VSTRAFLLLLVCAAAVACADAGDGSSSEAITYQGDVTPVTRAEDAQAGVFVPPFRSCTPPLDGKPGSGPDGTVCANVAISGAVEEGRYFPDYASCDVVVTQRPYHPAAPAAATDPNDPRLADESFMAELAWAREQLGSTGCACCHDSRSGRLSAQWDIAADGIWLDSLSDTGLALFTGLADSSVLGAYPAAENFGFDRNQVGVPTTDVPRMRKLMLDELARRQLTEDWARNVPAFGGPIYSNFVAKPKPCTAGEGVDADGVVHFPQSARYVYVMEANTQNPGVPPNLDLPAGTLWRLDVLPSDDPISAGFRYGTTPPGSFQHTPASTPAPPLFFGKTYHFVVVPLVGLTSVNCTFELQR